MNFEQYTKQELFQYANRLNIPCTQKNTKKEIIQILRKHVAKGGVFQLPLSFRNMPNNNRPVPKQHRTPNHISSTAIATGVEMMKDSVSSTIAKNALNTKKILPRTLNAVAAASDAVQKVKRSPKST